MISLLIEEKTDKNWNSRLLNSKQSTIYQTKEFSGFKLNIFVFGL